jgi:hypothetical protein
LKRLDREPICYARGAGFVQDFLNRPIEGLDGETNRCGEGLLVLQRCNSAGYLVIYIRETFSEKSHVIFSKHDMNRVKPTSVELVAHGLPRIVIVVPDDSSLEHADDLQAALVAETLDEIL